MSNTLIDTLRTWTNTNIFLAPLLGISRQELNENGFINAFIKDEVHGIDYTRGLYLLFKPKNADDFETFLNKERIRKAIIIDEYDYKGHTIVVYQYDEKWVKDVEKILDGQFSKTSEEFKKFFPKTRKITSGAKTEEILSTQHAIFRKSQEYIDYWKEELGLDIDYKEDEVWHNFKEREIFNENTIK